MSLLDRLRERELIRTNYDGTKLLFAVGLSVTIPGKRGWFRVTRHKVYPTTPWATYVVYGVHFDGGQNDG